MIHEAEQLERVEPTVEAVLGGEDQAPYCVEIHPTDFCNQRCGYCFHGGVGEDSSRRTEQLTIGEYVELFQDAEAMGVQEISISGGGEPFLSPSISGVLDWLSDSPLRTRIVTNGNYIPKDAIGGVLAADEIRFSIDATTAETYNQQRGMRSGNLLGRTLANMRTLVEERAAKASSLQIGATFLLSEVNLAEIEDFARLMLDEIGIDTVVYKYDIYNAMIPDGDRDKLISRLDALMSTYGPRVECREGVDDNNITGPCAMSYFKVALNPYGALASCCLGSQPGETNGVQLGSLRELGGLANLWASSETSRRNLLLGEGASCDSCNSTDQKINIIAREILVREGI